MANFFSSAFVGLQMILPASPSISIRVPGGICEVTPAIEVIAGIPSARAKIKVWLNLPPVSLSTPANPDSPFNDL